jgi:hypothetical protein
VQLMTTVCEFGHDPCHHRASRRNIGREVWTDDNELHLPTANS